MKKLRALVGFAYPDPKDLPRVLKAGGLRNLPEKERAEIWSRRIEVAAGEFHDGPEELRASWLEAGLVEGYGFSGVLEEPVRFFVAGGTEAVEIAPADAEPKRRKTK